MNQFAIGSMPVPGGFLGWFRKVHRADNEIVKGEKGLPIVFPTRAEAKAAAGDAMVAYINGSFVRSGEIIPAAKIEAERHFKKEKAA
ncbi:hypothetical protein RHSP_31849 [Rhizobium freirei PRF 81]|uniref:Uncharacterized protein n=1 Tax=Rhizobium freirei PRF 81 TaxID=363754 RepID=N6U072_9HYPH|nr:hypothetical protein [Rhizobium freirei]ENN86049.1 hypothetical protein RHSP_31849 [Rhizobium freirei PRF 81]